MRRSETSRLISILTQRADPSITRAEPPLWGEDGGCYRGVMNELTHETEALEIIDELPLFIEHGDRQSAISNIMHAALALAAAELERFTVGETPLEMCR